MENRGYQGGRPSFDNREPQRDNHRGDRDNRRDDRDGGYRGGDRRPPQDDHRNGGGRPDFHRGPNPEGGMPPRQYGDDGGAGGE